MLRKSSSKKIVEYISCFSLISLQFSLVTGQLTHIHSSLYRFSIKLAKPSFHLHHSNGGYLSINPEVGQQAELSILSYRNFKSSSSHLIPINRSVQLMHFVDQFLTGLEKEEEENARNISIIQSTKFLIPFLETESFQPIWLSVCLSTSKQHLLQSQR